MISTRAADCGALYRDERRKLISLAQTLADDTLRTVVRATPAWSVHDVIAHVVAIAADLNALRFPGAGGADAWTAAQVADRRHRTIDQLGAEWDHEGPTFEKGLDLLGYEFGSHYLGDLLQHVADINHTLGLDRVLDDDALVVALDFYLDTTHEALTAGGVGAIAVVCGNERWILGQEPVVATLTADRYDVFRCLGGRRGAIQIRAMTWSGQIDAVLPYLSAYPLPTITVDI